MVEGSRLQAQVLRQPDSSWGKMYPKRVHLEVRSGGKPHRKIEVEGQRHRGPGLEMQLTGLASFQKTLCNQPEKHI